jgi:hypothetical protein
MAAMLLPDALWDLLEPLLPIRHDEREVEGRAFLIGRSRNQTRD